MGGQPLPGDVFSAVKNQEEMDEFPSKPLIFNGLTQAQPTSHIIEVAKGQEQGPYGLPLVSGEPVPVGQDAEKGQERLTIGLNLLVVVLPGRSIKSEPSRRRLFDTPDQAPNLLPIPIGRLPVSS